MMPMLRNFASDEDDDDAHVERFCEREFARGICD
jgi:hypothetical protein